MNEVLYGCFPLTIKSECSCLDANNGILKGLANVSLFLISDTIHLYVYSYNHNCHQVLHNK